MGAEGWSAWIVYVLVGTMQVTIVITAIVFAIRDRRNARKGMGDSGIHDSSTNDETNERTALLASERR